MDTYKAIREIEKVIEAGEYQTRGYVKCGLRSWMLTRLTDAASTYLRRTSDQWSSVRHLAKEVVEEVSNAICYPDALTPDEMATVCGIYGDAFSYSWKVEPPFAKLLDHVPGGSSFKTSHDMSWTSNMKLRAKLADAVKLTLPIETVRKNNGNGSMHGNQEFAKLVGAFGYVENKGKYDHTESITYFFDNADDLVLAKMKYS